MFVKSDEREAARELRRSEGLPIGKIAERLGVAKSSVSRWVCDVELTPSQHAALRAQNPRYNAKLRGQRRRSAAARAVRLEAQAHGRALARGGDPLHLQGCMLYWAEGAKDRNCAALINSEPEMLRVFIRFLRDCYEVPGERMALTVNCHAGNGLDGPAIVRWWLDALALPACCARAPVVNRVSPSSRRRRGNVLPYGTARVAVFSTFVAQSILGAIQEYGGFERPAWLG